MSVNCDIETVKRGWSLDVCFSFDDKIIKQSLNSVYVNQDNSVLL